MAAMEDLVIFILRKQPQPFLPASVLVLYAYCCDWRASIVFGQQITNSVWELQSGTVSNPEFETSLRTSKYINTIAAGSNSNFWEQMVSISANKWRLALSEKEALLSAAIIERLQQKTFDQLTKLINSTYPVRIDKRDRTLDLIVLAKKYCIEKQQRSVQNEAISTYRLGVLPDPEKLDLLNARTLSEYQRAIK